MNAPQMYSAGQISTAQRKPNIAKTPSLIAPPVYRPQPAAVPIQRQAVRSLSAPVIGTSAPPVYRPQPAAVPIQRQAVRSLSAPVIGTSAPAVYRPQPAAAPIQRQAVRSLSAPVTGASAPAVYRPQPAAAPIQRQMAATGRLFNSYLCSGGMGVIQRLMAQCARCEKFFDDGAEYGTSDVSCPHCQAENSVYTNERDKYCQTFTCANYRRVVNTTGPFCTLCEERLIDAEEFLKIDNPPEEKVLTADERRLKAEMQAATSFVNSSGSHHKSTGGPHTRSARETHTSAHGTKAQVRKKYAVNLKELQEKVGSDSPLYKEADKMIKKVENK